MTLVSVRAARAELLLRSLETTAYAACSEAQRGAFRAQAGQVYLPPTFDAAVTRDDGRVAIYDIGPREQVQEVSTVARSANSLSLPSLSRHRHRVRVSAQMRQQPILVRPWAGRRHWSGSRRWLAIPSSRRRRSAG